MTTNPTNDILTGLTPTNMLKYCVNKYSMIQSDSGNYYSFNTFFAIYGDIIAIRGNKFNVVMSIIWNKNNSISCIGWLGFEPDEFPTALKHLDNIYNELKSYEFEYKQAQINNRIENLNHDF